MRVRVGELRVGPEAAARAVDPLQLAPQRLARSVQLVVASDDNGRGSPERLGMRRSYEPPETTTGAETVPVSARERAPEEAQASRRRCVNGDERRNRGPHRRRRNGRRMHARNSFPHVGRAGGERGEQRREPDTRGNQ